MQIIINGKSMTCHADASCVWIAKVDAQFLYPFEIDAKVFGEMPFKKCPSCAKSFMLETDLKSRSLAAA